MAKQPEILSTGKFSTVYKIEKERIFFILKTMHDKDAYNQEVIESFQKEIKFSNQFDFVPQIINHTEINGKITLLKEFKDGESVKNYIYSKSYSFEEKITMLISIIEKLEILHRNGFIHGDVKPANFLFHKEKKQVTVLDIGNIFELENLPIKTATPIYFSMLYGAPELVLNEPSRITTQTDLFSIGILLYEIITNDKSIYQESHPAILLQKMLSVSVPKTKNKQADEIIQKICAKPKFHLPPSQLSQSSILEILDQNIKKRYITHQELIERIKEIKRKRRWF